MSTAVTEDEKEFGVDAIVYCKQHLRPHATGWCTVSNSDKVKLESETVGDAIRECIARGYKLHEA